MPYKNVSLTGKLNILVLLALAVLLVGVILLLIHNTQNLTQEIGGERIVEKVNIIQSRLAEIEQELLVDADFVVTSVSFFQAVGRRDAVDTSDIIATANQSLGLDDIAVVDGDGKRLVDTSIDEDLSQEDEMLLRALSGSAIADLLIETNEGSTEISITAAAPVVSASGNILGAIQMSRDISDDFLRSLIFGQQGTHLALVYQDKIIARSDGSNHTPANIIRNNVALDLPSIQSARSGQTIVRDDLVLGAGGVPHTVAYTPVLSGAGNSPAVLAILVELEEIYSFQNSTLLNTILVFAAMTAVALAIISLNIFQTVIGPLKNLKTIAQTMTGGQYGERVPVNTADEVGQLAVAFNEMAGAVQQREISLQAAREQAERADQVKSMFLASVSHELRTPLNAIINLTKFVGLGMYGSVNPEQVDILQKVEARSKHLLNLINDVLDISKIESGSLELFVENDLKIDEMVRSAVETAQSLLVNKPVEIVHEISHDLPCLTGDAQRIHQIVLNLLSNACKFTEHGEIVVRAYREDSDVIISIQDSGPGIEPANQELIFEAFRQTKEGLRKGEGTGLGLAISRRLAEAHGGRVWLESELGKGATFFIALPVQTALVPTL